MTLAGDWSTIGTLLADPADVAFLEGLYSSWKPRLRVALAQTRSPDKLRFALQQLTLSCSRFNRRWQRFVDEIELTKLNERRAAYNRYYVLEKECALRSAALARQGFQPLSLVTTDDLFREFPLIRIPKLRD